MSGHIQRQQTFKQVDVGQSVVLDDTYLAENHRTMQIEAIALQTMKHAEDQANLTLEHARQESQQILAAANEKAERIIQDEGYAQRDALLQQAYEEGLQKGLEEGISQVSQEMSDKIVMADMVLQQAFEGERQLLSAQNDHLVELMQTVLKLVLHQELRTTPQQVSDIIGKALERLYVSGEARVIINPETLQLLKDCCAFSKGTFPAPERIRFVPDISCDPYEMFLETVEGSFDISPETQIGIYLNTVTNQLSETYVAAETEIPLLAEKNDIPPMASLSQDKPVSESIRIEPAMPVTSEDDESPLVDIEDLIINPGDSASPYPE